MLSGRRAARFSRIRVKDLNAFNALHAQASAAQSTYGIKEVIYQCLDDPADLTILMTGTRESINSWLKSPERAELASRLDLQRAVESWNAVELHGSGKFQQHIPRNNPALTEPITSGGLNQKASTRPIASNDD